MSSKNSNSNSLLVSQIKSFLESYQNEQRKNKKSTAGGVSTYPSSGMFGSMSSYDSSMSSMGQADPTTANALNTSTVVILRKKKNSSLKNSPFDGVCLPNYRLRLNDVRREVFDWVSYFLTLKNCPGQLATPIATHIANRMDAELMKKFEDTSNSVSSSSLSTDNGVHQPDQQQQPALMSSPELADNAGNGASLFGAGGGASPLNPYSLDTLDSTPRSSLPSALCSVDVARQSRELVNEYIEELSSNPDNAVEIVNDYLDSGLQSPGASAANSPNGQATPFTSSVFAIKNGRKTMEDRHIIIHDLNKALNLQTSKQYSYYAIFDGHAGVDAASYSTAHLHNNLVSTEAFAEGRIEDAFQEAFEKTDSLYIKRCREDGVDQLKPSGTTALCALIEDNKTVYLAWVGDSQAVLVRNGHHEEIMLPHRPDVESERIRIQDLGGLVVFVDTWRVNGVLSVTRAIGDPEHKPYVIAEPSLAKFEIDSSLDFLVLGCDGLFDQLASQDIAAYVFEFLCRNENRDPQEVMHDVSSYLSQMAIKEGSCDNITSIVIFFKPFEQLVATGYPTEDEANSNQAGQQQEVTEAIVSASEHRASVTTLPTNGGHFPYTDFSELPIGSNFKLSPYFAESAPSTNGEDHKDDNNGTEEENAPTFESMIEQHDDLAQQPPQTVLSPESLLIAPATEGLLLMDTPADTIDNSGVFNLPNADSQITSSPFFDNSISTFCVSQQKPEINNNDDLSSVPIPAESHQESEIVLSESAVHELEFQPSQQQLFESDIVSSESAENEFQFHQDQPDQHTETEIVSSESQLEHPESEFVLSESAVPKLESQPEQQPESVLPESEFQPEQQSESAISELESQPEQPAPGIVLSESALPDVESQLDQPKSALPEFETQPDQTESAVPEFESQLEQQSESAVPEFESQLEQQSESAVPEFESQLEQQSESAVPEFESQLEQQSESAVPEFESQLEQQSESAVPEFESQLEQQSESAVPEFESHPEQPESAVPELETQPDQPESAVPESQPEQPESEIVSSEPDMSVLELQPEQQPESAVPELESLPEQFAVTSENNNDYFEQEHDESDEVVAVLTSCLALSSEAQLAESDNNNLFDNDSDNCDFVFVKPAPELEVAEKVSKDEVCDIDTFAAQQVTSESDQLTTMEEGKLNGYTNGHVVNGDHHEDESHNVIANQTDDLVNTLEKLNLSAKDPFDCSTKDDQICEDQPLVSSTSSAAELTSVAGGDQTLIDNSDDNPPSVNANVAEISEFCQPQLVGDLVDTTVSSEMGVPMNDDSVSDNSAPEIIQHPSDSGYCYTNSINEFSTSFPSENKLDDNFCSTPVLVAQQPDLLAAVDDDDESGLVGDNQSSILPDVSAQQTFNVTEFDTLDNSNAQSTTNDSSDLNNWQDSLHNNSTVFTENVMKTSEDEVVISSSKTNFDDLLMAQPESTPAPINNDVAVCQMDTQQEEEEDEELEEWEPSPREEPLFNRYFLNEMEQKEKNVHATEDVAVCQMDTQQQEEEEDEELEEWEPSPREEPLFNRYFLNEMEQKEKNVHATEDVAVCQMDTQQPQEEKQVCEPVQPNEQTSFDNYIINATDNADNVVVVASSTQQHDNGDISQDLVKNVGNDADILIEPAPQQSTTSDLINLPESTVQSSGDDNLMFDLSHSSAQESFIAQSASIAEAESQMKSQMDEISSSTNDEQKPVLEIADLDYSSQLSQAGEESAATIAATIAAAVEAEPALVELESELAPVESVPVFKSTPVVEPEPTPAVSDLTQIEDKVAAPVTETESLIESSDAVPSVDPPVPQEDSTPTALISTAVAAVGAAAVVGAVAATKSGPKKPVVEAKSKVAAASTLKKPLTTTASKLKTTTRSSLTSAPKLSSTTKTSSVPARTSVTKTAPLKSTTATGAKPATTATSRLSTSTLSNPRTTLSTASKAPASSTTARVPLTRKPLTSTVAPRSTTASRPATTSTSRPATTSTSRPATISTSRPTTTSTSRPGTTSASRPAAASSTTRPATGTASRLTTSSSQLRTAASKTEPKPSVAPARKPLSTRPTAATSAATSKPSTTRTSTLPARTTATKPSVASTRAPATKTPAAPVASKVSSIRPATTRPSLSHRTAPTKTTPSAKTNGTSSTASSNTNGQVKAVGRKPPTKVAPAVDQSLTTSTTESALSNGNSVSASMKNSPSFSSTHKRNNLIGVENSLKQELEDAAMNEMNGSMISGSTAAETTDFSPVTTNGNGSVTGQM